MIAQTGNESGWEGVVCVALLPGAGRSHMAS